METLQGNQYLTLDENSKRHLLGTIGWTRFISIVGFIFIGFFLFAGIGIAFSANILSMFAGNLPMQNVFMMLGGIGFLILYQL